MQTYPWIFDISFTLLVHFNEENDQIVSEWWDLHQLGSYEVGKKKSIFCHLYS